MFLTNLGIFCKILRIFTKYIVLGEEKSSSLFAEFLGHPVRKTFKKKTIIGFDLDLALTRKIVHNDIMNALVKFQKKKIWTPQFRVMKN